MTDGALKLVFDDRFLASGYADDNAATPGRMEAAMSGLLGGPWELLAPPPATREELALAHGEAYLAKVAEDGPRFAMASLAAGGAILAARTAHGGEPAFACVRPPGHHAARGEAWGHCTFSNVALALLVLRQEQRIDSALVIDIDAHTGDGTRAVLAAWPEATAIHAYFRAVAPARQIPAVVTTSQEGVPSSPWTMTPWLGMSWSAMEVPVARQAMVVRSKPHSASPRTASAVIWALVNRDWPVAGSST